MVSGIPQWTTFTGFSSCSWWGIIWSNGYVTRRHYGSPCRRLEMPVLLRAFRVIVSPGAPFVGRSAGLKSWYCLRRSPLFRQFLSTPGLHPPLQLAEWWRKVFFSLREVCTNQRCNAKIKLFQETQTSWTRLYLLNFEIESLLFLHFFMVVGVPILSHIAPFHLRPQQEFQNFHGKLVKNGALLIHQNLQFKLARTRIKPRQPPYIFLND